MSKINLIKKKIKQECEAVKDLAELDFYNSHLLAVEKFAKIILDKQPKADKNIVMLGVWLHDLQYIKEVKGDHEKIGAEEAEKVMREFDYGEHEIKKVKEIILSHSCKKNLPKTLEGKILSSADAMSHYVNDFYLRIGLQGYRNLEEYKKWALEKLDKDYNKKIFFNFAKKLIKKKHEYLVNFFIMK